MAAGTAAPAAGADVDAAGAPSYKNACGVPLMQAAFNARCVEEIKRKDHDTGIVSTKAMINRPAVDIHALYNGIGVGPLVDTYAPRYFPGLPELRCPECNGKTTKAGCTRPRRAHAFHCDWWCVGRRMQCCGGCPSFSSYDADAVAQYAATLATTLQFSCHPSPSSTPSSVNLISVLSTC
jgi:hypothetical protein